MIKILAILIYIMSNVMKYIYIGFQLLEVLCIANLLWNILHLRTCSCQKYWTVKFHNFTIKKYEMLCGTFTLYLKEF